MRFVACVCAGVVSGCACVVHECSFLVKKRLWKGQKTVSLLYVVNVFLREACCDPAT